MLDIKRVNQKVVDSLPKVINRVQQHVPIAFQTKLLSFALNRFFQQELAADRLSFMRGKRIVIKVADCQLAFAIELKQHRLAASFAATDSDLTIIATSKDMVAMINNQVDPDSLFFRRRLSMSGDTELALYCKNLLDSIGIERFPAPLARVLQWLGEQHNQPTENGI
ncbi:MAG: SCP2 domain-containing protein [Aestuariibacter sp.]